MTAKITRQARTGKPPHPEADWHGEHKGQWWHMSAPPNSKPLEPCKCGEREWNEMPGTAGEHKEGGC